MGDDSLSCLREKINNWLGVVLMGDHWGLVKTDQVENCVEEIELDKRFEQEAYSKE